MLRRLFSTVAMGTCGRVSAYEMVKVGCQQRRVASAQLSHRYPLFSCPVMLPALMNVLAVGEDHVNLWVRVAVVSAISDAVLMITITALLLLLLLLLLQVYNYYYCTSILRHQKISQATRSSCETGDKNSFMLSFLSIGWKCCCTLHCEIMSV